MCQVQEEEEGQYYSDLQGEQPKFSPKQRCVKCKEGVATLVIRAGDSFCRDCFKEYFVHKFRAMLGKNRLVYPGEKVLLALSGGPSSSSMVRQVQEGMSHSASKKLRFIPGIVHVNEGTICGQNLNERVQATAQMESIVTESGFPFHIIPLEEVFNLPESLPQRHSPELRNNYRDAVDGFIRHQQSLQNSKNDLVPSQVHERLSELSFEDPAGFNGEAAVPCITGSLPPSHLHTQTLTNLFSSVKTLTAKEELLQTLRNHLILQTARAHGYSKVMMGDSCTRLAIKSMTNISLGRGAFLARDTGFSDDRFGDVVVVRPMRDYSLKEISYYNRIFAVPTVFFPSLDTKASAKASVHRLTEDFITNLQADFPSTVSTVYRTSEKLTVNHKNTVGGADVADRCLLCMCSLDTNLDEASAFHATLISERFSQKVRTSNISSSSKSCSVKVGEQAVCCGNPIKGCASNPRGDGKSSFLGHLCYGCRLTVKDMTSLDHLPSYILAEAEQRIRRTEMKKEIQDFLIEDDEMSDRPTT